MTLALASPRLALPDLRRMASDAPALTILAIVLFLGLIPLYAAMALDTRIFQSESPWMKPVKFHYALGLYTISLAFFARFTGWAAGCVCRLRGAVRGSGAATGGAPAVAG